VRKSEEPRQNAHWHRVRSFPAVDGINRLPLLLLHEGHEGVHVPGAGVATELSVGHMENCWQGGDEEATGKSWIFTESGGKFESELRGKKES
jgi:hypothetical protein